MKRELSKTEQWLLNVSHYKQMIPGLPAVWNGLKFRDEYHLAEFLLARHQGNLLRSRASERTRRILSDR